MNLEQIAITIHTYLAKGEEPEFSLKSWIKIYGALHSFNRVVEEYINSNSSEEFEQNVGKIIYELEKGSNEDIISDTHIWIE